MSPIKVLVVDDDPLVLNVNKYFVEEVPGFRVVGCARNGNDAVQAAGRLRPDLILLDVYMPDQDGLAALRELRSHGIPSDVILVSAAADPASVEEALRFGAHDYIIKPFRPERLRQALDSYRHMKRKLRAAVRLSQAEVDQMWRDPGHQVVGDLPKGLNQVTLQQVLAYLSEQTDPVTAGNVGAAVGVARVTARRYLEYLVKLGQVRLEVRHGSVGRPVNQYQLVKP